MTKLIIQIPCFNEAECLPATLAKLPRSIHGIDEIEVLVIDDGSTDDTTGIARRWGVHHIVRHRRNRGLAAAFQSGIEAGLRAGADIIVNTDADGQYAGEDVASLVAPVLKGRADITVGDRGVRDNAHFGSLKRLLQRLGSRVVRYLSQTEIPDAVSGFRAISREGAARLFITADFSYTTDMLIQAGRKRLRIVSVPVRTNPAARPSRLFRSIPHFISQTAVTMIRAYTIYNPLKVFGATGLLLTAAGGIPILRFLWFSLLGEAQGHIQSLVIGGSLVILGGISLMLGLLADLISVNRKLSEATLEKLRHLEVEFAAIGREAEPAVQEGVADFACPASPDRMKAS